MAPAELLVVPRLLVRAAELEERDKYAFGQYLKVYDRTTGELLREGMVAVLHFDTHMEYGGNLYNNWWEEHQEAPEIINATTQQREPAYTNQDAERVEIYVEDPEATVEDPDMTEADSSSGSVAWPCGYCRKKPQKYECTFDCGAMFCSQTCFESSLHMFRCSARKPVKTVT
jgi:hypothetical protein